MTPIYLIYFKLLCSFEFWNLHKFPVGWRRLRGKKNEKLPIFFNDFFFSLKKVGGKIVGGSFWGEKNECLLRCVGGIIIGERRAAPITQNSPPAKNPNVR